jgi:hypothetical protein
VAPQAYHGSGTMDYRSVCVKALEGKPPGLLTSRLQALSRRYARFFRHSGAHASRRQIRESAKDLAAKIGCPMIGINDSGGARIQEGVVSLGSYGTCSYETSAAPTHSRRLVGLVEERPRHMSVTQHLCRCFRFPGAPPPSRSPSSSYTVSALLSYTSRLTLAGSCAPPPCVLSINT